MTDLRWVVYYTMWNQEQVPYASCPDVAAASDITAALNLYDDAYSDHHFIDWDWT